MKRNMMLRIIVFIFLILLGTLFVLSCSEKDSQESSPAGKEESEEVETVEETESEQTGKRKILMMGRSVMGGWFEYWGSDTSGPVKHGDFILYYKELDVPPDIVDSVEQYVDEVDDNETIIFFKFCFDDFQAGDKSESRANLSDNKKYIRQVYDSVVEERGLKLIIGNALPKVKAYTDSNLVQNHRSFNEWLEEFAEEHAGQVYIFDQYSVLTDSRGNLKSEYALDKEDSHLNNKAYSALDGAFFDYLDTNF